MWSYFKIMMWACIWWWIWLFTFPWRKGRDNCLTWAQHKHVQEGGYLTIRWSRNNKGWLHWPHFGWLAEKYHPLIEHYVPKEGEVEKYVPDMWFDGKVKFGDREDEDKD